MAGELFRLRDTVNVNRPTDLWLEKSSDGRTVTLVAQTDCAFCNVLDIYQDGLRFYKSVGHSHAFKVDEDGQIKVIEDKF